MELGTCRFIANYAALEGETLWLSRCTQGLAALLCLRWGEIELQCGDVPPVQMREKDAFLFSLEEERQVHVQKDAAWTLCAIQCGQPDMLLETWAAGESPVRSCRGLLGADQMLHQISVLPLGPEQKQALKLPVRLLRSLLDQGASTHPDIPAYLMVMRQIIETQYQKGLTLENLAVQVGKSKFHLSRAFQSCYHITPSEYLTHVRLSHAAQLLTNTALPVQEIGRSVGISNGAYFTALFKRQYGCPPREYRIKSSSIRGQETIKAHEGDVLGDPQSPFQQLGGCPVAVAHKG